MNKIICDKCEKDITIEAKCEMHIWFESDEENKDYHYCMDCYKIISKVLKK